MLEAHYLDTANLTFIAPNSKTPVGGRFHIRGMTGIQQGNLASAGMFIVGQHQMLVRVSKHYNMVFIFAYADNLFLIGPMEQCFQS